VRRALRWIADHPTPIGIVVLLLTVAFALALPRLRIDESAEGLMVRNDPAREFYEQAKRRFGSDNLTIVLIKADDVFAPDVLVVVSRLSESLARLEHVSRVESLTTVRNIKTEGDLLNTERLVEPLPRTREEAARIRRDALDNRVFVGNLVARDGRATAVTVYADPPAGDGGFNTRFVERVDALIAEVAAPGLAIFQVGAPLTKATYAHFVRADQLTVIPLSVAMLLLTLWLAFRTLQGVVIPLVTAVVSIIWGLGAMALVGIPLTILTGTIPSLLLAIGFAEDVHMISEYHHRLEQGADKATALWTMIDQAGLPLLVTTATTVLGFGSLVFTDITMLVQFGWASSMALVANFLVTFAILPLLLRVWRVPRRLRPAAFRADSSEGTLPRVLGRLAEFNLRHRATIFAVWGLLVAGSLVGWATLRVNTDLVSFFPERSVIRTRIDELHRSLAGGLAFYIVVDTGRDNGVKEPALLARMADLQTFLATTGLVDTSVSLADYVRRMHREMNGGDPALEVVPDSPDLVAQYLLTLEDPELAKFVDFTAAAANIVVRHNLSGSGDLSALLGRIDTWTAQHFPPTVRVRPTGEAILFNNASDFMAINEVTSFSLTFVVIAIIHALLFTSLKAGVLSMIPNLAPILCVYGVMGLLGIPLNTATAIIATLAIGIAVDDTVHHMVTFSRQLNRHHDERRAMFATVRSQGRPIIYVSVALAAGFLTLTASNFVPTVTFGLLAAFAMLLAMAGELTLTPLLMVSTRLVTLWDLLLVRIDAATVRAAPLFQGLSTWEARKVVLLGRLQAVEPGEVVIGKGELGSEMYMIVTGRVRVFERTADGREKALAVLGPGAIVGEMALVSQERRSAWVVAEERTEVLRLDFEALERIRRRFPYTSAKLFRNLARVLAGRLRDVTTMLVEEQPPLPGGPAALPATAREPR
jgi:hypothetical protein